jgi:LPS-assembly lipoprotein
VLGAGLPLTACGFEPVYKQGSLAAGLQGQIVVSVLEGRNGFELRERLEERLGFAQSDAKYSLKFTLSIKSEDLTVSSDAEITRFNLEGVSAFSVTDRTTGAIVFRDSVRSFTAYSATSETYPTRVAEQDANIRLAQSLAELITTRLSITAKDWAS